MSTLNSRLYSCICIIILVYVLTLKYLNERILFLNNEHQLVGYSNYNYENYTMNPQSDAYEHKNFINKNSYIVDIYLHNSNSVINNY